VEQAILETPGIARVQGSTSGDTAIFRITLEAAPETTEAFATIERLRSALTAVPEASALVGGADAQALDQQNGMSRDLRLIIPLVLATVLILLILVLRSLVAPVVLVGTVLLSFGAALGASVLVFEHLFGFGAVEPSVPLLAFVFLVALGVDYNIFLMTRVQEETRQSPMPRAVVRGLAATGGVITSAGLVLAATFSVLTVLPLVMMVQLGFIVAFGVLLDAVIVRSILVPAIAVRLGDRMWWPYPLARRRQGQGDVFSTAGR
jgi:putative drug exporter of the RND superfamily